MPMTQLYLKILVGKMCPIILTESGADLGISERGAVCTLIAFESMGLDGKRQRHKLLRCSGDKVFNFFLFYAHFHP